MTCTTEKKWNALAIPAGALEELLKPLKQIAKIQGLEIAKLDPIEAWIFCADNGIAADNNVNAHPQAVTRLMTQTFLDNKSAACSLATCNGVRLNVADCGMQGSSEFERAGFQGSFIENKLLTSGTADIRKHAAMNREQFDAAWEVGVAAVEDSFKRGCRFLIFGEMGIGNTSTSTAVAAMLLKHPEIKELTGRGAGLPKERLQEKEKAITDAMNRANATLAKKTPHHILMELGGFDLVAMTAAFLQAKKRKIAVLLDGFIVSVAALCAQKIDGPIGVIPSTYSKEPGHRLVLDHLPLKSKPLVDLNLCLGEASAALLAVPILRGALSILENTATLNEVLERR